MGLQEPRPGDIGRHVSTSWAMCSGSLRVGTTQGGASTPSLWCWLPCLPVCGLSQTTPCFFVVGGGTNHAVFIYLHLISFYLISRVINPPCYICFRYNIVIQQLHTLLRAHHVSALLHPHHYAPLPPAPSVYSLELSVCFLETTSFWMLALIIGNGGIRLYDLQELPLLLECCVSTPGVNYFYSESVLFPHLTTRNLQTLFS